MFLSKMQRRAGGSATSALVGVMMFGVSAHGATATFDIVPADADPASIVRLEDRTIVPIEGTNDFEVRVQPGGEVPYEIYVTVTSDLPAANDNGGLAFFSVTVATNFGVEQLPVDELDPTIAQLFPIVQSLGSPVLDNIVQIGGGQQTFTGAIQFNVAVNNRTLLARGRLITPLVNLGIFLVENGEGTTANVFRVVGLEAAMAASIASGQSIDVRTTLDLNEGLPGDGDGSTDGDDGTTDGDDGSTDGDDGSTDGDDGGSGIDFPTIPPSTGVILAAAMLVVIGLAGLAVGPWGVMIALILAPAAALIAIFSGAI